MKYSIANIITQEREGKRLKYLCFWGHQPIKDGSIGASCLSQWWLSPFTVNRVTYTSAEHWMMAKKAELFDNQDIVNHKQSSPCRS